MNRYIEPDRSIWGELCQRAMNDDAVIDSRVSDIILKVRNEGDAALRELALNIDKVQLDNLEVSQDELREAEKKVSPEVKKAIEEATCNIRKFHQAQLFRPIEVETYPGVKCVQRAVPIQRVGLYIPGGTAPLFSTVLMLTIPAKVAGCKEVILCTPTDKQGNVAPTVLYAANYCGISHIYKVGGAQAIAAMAYGTETIEAVDKIFGPGNRYVTKAKEQVSRKVSIDMPAGPSEVMVMADETSNPQFVASDLLSQAEHGADSQVILVCSNEKIANAVEVETDRQLQLLPRKDLTEKALTHSRIIILGNTIDQIAFANRYAAEHLIISLQNPWEVANQITAAGSVFIGNYSPESAGDYASGTNHTLPTSGWARSCSGVNVDSFIRKITYQELTPSGISRLGKTIVTMAEAEGLDAHANAARLRIDESKIEEPCNKSIRSLVRSNIANLAPYSTARDEYKGELGVFLDANENPFPNHYNRYPDPRQLELKKIISQIKNVPIENIFVGNGSDEAIDLCFRIFCEPGIDNAIAIKPSYGMYRVSADINNIEMREIQLGEDFSLPVEQLLAAADDNTKLMFLCSPNNPSGNSFPREQLISLIERFKGIVVIDEAYIDFASQESLRPLAVSKYPNLIIMQTLSKAFGMAGLRLGLAFSNTEIMQLFANVKYPYNINTAGMEQATSLLLRDVKKEVDIIKSERTRVCEALKNNPTILKVYPTDANFVLVKVEDANAVYNRLIENKVIVRNRSHIAGCAGCLRITIGTPEENDIMLNNI